MTAAERRQAAKVLREWAAWCERNPDVPWWIWPCDLNNAVPDGRIIALAVGWGPPDGGTACGDDAATGLCLAAAMIESGDSA